MLQQNWRRYPGDWAVAGSIAPSRQAVIVCKDIFSGCSCTGARLVTPPGRSPRFLTAWRIWFFRARCRNWACPMSGRHAWPGCTTDWRIGGWFCAACSSSTPFWLLMINAWIGCCASVLSSRSRCWPTAPWRLGFLGSCPMPARHLQPLFAEVCSVDSCPQAFHCGV